MRKSWPAGVVFDMDGVLIDTERLSHRVWREIGQELGCPGPGEHHLEVVGCNWVDICAALEPYCAPVCTAAEFLTRCAERSQEIMARDGVPVKEGARELLEFLRDNGVPAALATSTGEVRARWRLEHAGLLPYFQSFTFGDLVLHSKPDPEIYLLACRRAGFEPGQVWAVEDSRNGILSAHAAGLKPVMVPDLIPPTPELDKLLFRRFESLVELKDFLANS